MNRQLLASKLDSTLLRPDATSADITRLCDQALALCTATVCVNPIFVPQCRQTLADSPVKVCTVAGFPLGAMLPSAKAFEAMMAVREGAQELDMVLAIGALRDRRYDYVRDDIAEVVEACGDVPVKVILETCLLSDDEIITAVRLCEEAGAAFVKTSTGLSAAGATTEHVRLMKQHAGRMKVKAAGGIRTTQNALDMLAAGADRIGTSAAADLVGGLAE